MNKSLIAFFFMSIFMLASWLGISYLFKKDTLQVKRIVLINKLHEQNEQQLQYRASRAMSGGFFSLDIKKFRENIESLAWVDSLSVRKKWPDSLQLEIHEKKVFARWIASDNKNRTIKKLLHKKWDKESLLSDKGEVFKTPLSPSQYKKYQQFAIFSAPADLSFKGLKKCQQIAKLLAVTHLAIKQCLQDQRRSWYVQLDNGFNLFLGRIKNKAYVQGMEYKQDKQQQNEADDILKRMKIFISAYQQILKKYEKNIDRIDMRYTNGFAIKWKTARA